MSLEIPKNNATELLIYLWKIIDLPYISLQNLIYTISFNLFILPPEDARTFIKKAVEKKLLKIDENKISLSPTLKKRIETWQEKSKNKIKNNLELRKEHIFKPNRTVEIKKPEFNVLLRAFLDRGTINRAAAIPNDAFQILTFDDAKGIIKAEVSGSKEKPYKIEINTNEMLLTHGCHDFKTRRSINKKFCKHLVKLFLLLKKKDEEKTLDFLIKISNNINEWEFMG